jgi:DNA mismatch repair protein MutL
VQTSGDGSLANAVADVWGRESARALAPVDFYNGTARVRGFVSPPHFTKPTRSHQWMFVNGRPVRSRTLQSALDQALRSLTPDKRFPLAVLMLDVDPERVDVNVSPTKSEVRFHHEGAVFDAVKRGVSNALLETGMVPHAEGLAAANAALSSGQLGLEVSQPGGIFALAQWAQSPLQVEGAKSAELAATIGSASTSFLDGLRILAQVDNTFILAENDQGILVIDQHVAHERVCYEHLLATRGQGQIETQSLIQPETLHFDKRTIEVVAERFEELRAIGFEIERFGGDSVLVRSVPALWRGRQPLQVLRDVVNELADGLGQGCLNTLRDDVYIMCSCKMAIKAGDPLGQAEMEKLVFDLAQTENPFLCPHGRPITIVLPKSDLYRRFKRH